VAQAGRSSRTLDLLLFLPLSADVIDEYVSFPGRRGAGCRRLSLEAVEFKVAVEEFAGRWTEDQTARAAELSGRVGPVLAGSMAYVMGEIEETCGPRHWLKLGESR
jgi:hypothetical protein